MMHLTRMVAMPRENKPRFSVHHFNGAIHIATNKELALLLFDLIRSGSESVDACLHALSCKIEDQFESMGELSINRR